MTVFEVAYVFICGVFFGYGVYAFVCMLQTIKDIGHTKSLGRIAELENAIAHVLHNVEGADWCEKDCLETLRKTLKQGVKKC